MKKPRILMVVIILTLVVLACTCNLSDRFMGAVAEIEPTETPQPTSTFTPEPTVTPTESSTETPTETATPLAEDPTPTAAERPLLPPAEIEDLLADTEGLFFWFGSELYRTDLSDFSTEVFYVSEYVPEFRWPPDRQYQAYIEREDSEDGRDRPGGSLVIETFPEGEILTFDDMPENVFSYSWGPEPWQITLSTFDSDALWPSDEDADIASIQILDLETGSLEILLTDSEPELHYIRSWSPDKGILLYSKARYATGYYPRASVIDRQTLETIDLPCNLCWWSPDGRSFAGTGFSTYVRVDLPLLLVDFPSLAVKELYLREGYTADRPIWSPQGDWIAFSIYTCENEDYAFSGICYRQSIPLLIHVQTQRLVEIPVSDAYPLLWHPEGKQVLLVVRYEQNYVWVGESIYLYDLETDTTNLIFETDERRTSGFRFILQE